MTDWYWLTLKRLGRNDDAAKALEPIHEGMDSVSNVPYYRRLKIYKGIDPVPDPISDGDGGRWVTFGYGIAKYLEFTGNKQKADEILDRIVKTDVGAGYFAFAYIAALVEKVC